MNAAKEVKKTAPKAAKSDRQLIAEAFPTKDDEILYIHDVGTPCYRLNFWNGAETAIARSYFVQVVDGVAEEWKDEV